jgi:hypothetical protein
MNKQEVIRKAYGEYWETYKDLVDENGWFYNRFTGNDVPNKQLDFRTEKDDKQRPFRFRIKGLQGIENNNGWIRIESEEDFPKEYGYYHFIWLDAQNNERNEIYKVNKGINCHPSACITHYQPITKPLKPIY